MFDIDTPTLVVASVFMAAVFGLFLYYFLKIKRLRRVFWERFNQFTTSLNISSDQQEVWRDRFVLAMDKQQKMLVYCDLGEPETKLVCRLQEVRRAEVMEDYRQIDTSSSSRKILENLALKIEFKNSGKAPLLLQVYSAEDYSDLMGESVLAHHWARLINEHLTK